MKQLRYSCLSTTELLPVLLGKLAMTGEDQLLELAIRVCPERKCPRQHDVRRDPAGPHVALLAGAALATWGATYKEPTENMGPAWRLARPKSSSFRPELASLRFSGFAMHDAAAVEGYGRKRLRHAAPRHHLQPALAPNELEQVRACAELQHQVDRIISLHYLQQTRNVWMTVQTTVRRDLLFTQSRMSGDGLDGDCLACCQLLCQSHDAKCALAKNR